MLKIDIQGLRVKPNIEVCIYLTVCMWTCWYIIVYLQLAEPLLPYALAFAAGAMVYVVVDDIVPEAHSWYVPTYDVI